MSAYITAAELRAIIPDEYRDAALADTSGEPDAGLMRAVILAASAEVDALIEGRVRLPLSDPFPQKIKIAAMFLALETLYIRRGLDLPANTAEKVKFWREWLSKIGLGELRLDAPSDGSQGGRYTGAIASRPSVTGSSLLMN